VRAHTKASASCGTCTGLVEQLLSLTLGDKYNPSAVQPMCKCTDLGHDDVRRLIIAKGLRSIPQLMQELEWKTSCGCAKCRPALNYYLLATWPGEYEDDGQSRFINERVHANIQKDGTYSVVPRMWGGLTSPKELRAIATSQTSQDPDRQGTGPARSPRRRRKTPGVWADLNAPAGIGRCLRPGAAYGQDCVGRNGAAWRLDSTGLGSASKVHVGSWTGKVKIAVSNAAAPGRLQDVGVICVDSGYDIVFTAQRDSISRHRPLPRQHRGRRRRGHQRWFIYREHRYLERIYKWMKRWAGTDRQGHRRRSRQAPALLRSYVYSQKGAGRLGKSGSTLGTPRVCRHGRIRRPGSGGVNTMNDYRNRRSITYPPRRAVQHPLGVSRVYGRRPDCHRGPVSHKGPLTGHRPRRAGHVSFAQLGISLETGKAQGADEGWFDHSAHVVDGPSSWRPISSRRRVGDMRN
jgi:bacterioferritin-associated ferredoxin